MEKAPVDAQDHIFSHNPLNFQTEFENFEEDADIPHNIFNTQRHTDSN